MDEHPLDGTPVTRDSDVHARLVAKWQSMDTPTFTAYAIEHGYQPPVDEDGWAIAYEENPDGPDPGLVWCAPSYPED